MTLNFFSRVARKPNKSDAKLEMSFESPHQPLEET
jgi:hypothetical protein